MSYYFPTFILTAVIICWTHYLSSDWPKASKNDWIENEVRERVQVPVQVQEVLELFFLNFCNSSTTINILVQLLLLLLYRVVLVLKY